ncbi:MAG: epoxyqueuosine reductase, partial [bacterium]|nr:epoxyqueuosine reductase [bacterium]
MDSLKNDLISYAHNIGLELIGITSPEPFDRYLTQLESRKEHYSQRYAYRLDSWKTKATPKEVINNAKSVVVIGFYYLNDEENVFPEETTGTIGRIVSHGHLGILKRAQLICQFLKKKGFKASMGVHRKEAAVRAGLGNIGKNDLVLNESFGSWVAYQSIVTDAQLEPDAPFTKDLCGKCDDCLKACPTSALYEPHKLDPRLCITYQLTSRDVSEDFWDAMRACILGCDACIEACPKNNGLSPKKNVDSFLPKNIGIHPPLKRFLSLSEEAFQKEVIGFIQAKISSGKFLDRIMSFKWMRKISGWFIKTFLKGK